MNLSKDFRLVALNEFFASKTDFQSDIFSVERSVIDNQNFSKNLVLTVRQDRALARPWRMPQSQAFVQPDIAAFSPRRLRNYQVLEGHRQG